MAAQLTPREAGLRLGISYPTIKQWLYRGKIKGTKTPGGHYRIDESELDAFLYKADSPATPKREMLRTVSGRNQLVGRLVEVKIDGLMGSGKDLDRRPDIDLDHYRRCGPRAAAHCRRNCRCSY